MSIIVKEVSGKDDLNAFINLPFKLYEGNENWVAPIKQDYKKYIMGVDNELNKVGPHKTLIAVKDGKIAARLIVGVNNSINKYHNLNEGYISQFECIEDYDVCKAILDEAENFLKSLNIENIKGPLSLPGGEDNRGFIVDNFNEQTYIMNVYNKSYYNDFFVKYGFKKYFDCYAYKSTVDHADISRYEKLVPYAMKKFDFRIDNINLKDYRKDAQDIKEIIEKSMPKEWLDFIPLSQEEINMVVKQLVPFADEDLIFIARDNKSGEAIGFNITLPDYNQAIKHMKGKILPFGLIKFLYYKRKINRLRFFVLFVVPEYRNKGVTTAMYLQTYINACKKGYRELEGSTIWEYNTSMINDIESFGAKKNITYRIYTKKI